MERKVVCIVTENGSNYDDCRQIGKVGYELRDGVYERSPEFIHRRIEDGEEFYIEVDDEQLFLKAVSDAEDDEGAAGDADEVDEEEEEDDREYVRVADEDTADDPLLTLDPCQ